MPSCRPRAHWPTHSGRCVGSREDRWPRPPTPAQHETRAVAGTRADRAMAPSQKANNGSSLGQPGEPQCTPVAKPQDLCV